MAPLSLQALTVGDRVQHELLVVERADKTTKEGQPFAILTLGNASGQIATAPLWSDQLAKGWADGVRKGTVVQAIGQVSMYVGRGGAKRQLELTAPLSLLPTARFSPEEFLPSVGDTTRLWDFVDTARAKIASPRLRQVLDLFFADDDFRVRFERAPGSTGGHHAKIGGLLLHVAEVVRIGRETARTMKADADVVTAGALLHDVGKVESYEIGPGGFSFTPCGLLVGHVVLGVLMLERAIAKVGAPVCGDGQLLELQHMILSHHGSLEFGSPVQPMTTEAEILHWADEASAKANDMMESIEDPEAFADGGEVSDKRVWRVGRRVWRKRHSWEEDQP
jgi:3'-5' exoribonuclease